MPPRSACQFPGGGVAFSRGYPDDDSGLTPQIYLPIFSNEFQSNNVTSSGVTTDIAQIEEKPSVELKEILELVNAGVKRSGLLVYETEINARQNTVTVFTPLVKEMQIALENDPAVLDYAKYVEYVYRNDSPYPADPEYYPPVPHEPRPIDVGFPEDVLQQYADAFGVPLEEAERRLILQDTVSDLQRQVSENESTFAGSWLVHEPEFGLVIVFASPNGQEILDKYLQGREWESIVSAQEATYTLDELLEILDLVNNAAAKTGVRFASGTYIQEGKVVLYTPDPDALRMNSTKTDINWNSAPGWTQCCSNSSPPREQAGKVISHQ